MTNQLSLQQQCSRLYKKMLQQLAGYERTPAIDEKKWIEWGFAITTKTWLGIQQEADYYQFYDQQEEIGFYKVLKPRFIGLMDYFTLLYKSVLFLPEAVQGKIEYWDGELATCRSFLSKHSNFCRYYEQGKTTMDHVYFVRQTNKQPLIFGVNENIWHVITSHSYLLARVIATQKYYHYIQEKLTFLQKAVAAELMHQSGS